MIKVLNDLLAMLSVSSNNVRGRHWTVYGNHYQSWHPLFNEIYELLSKSADNVAELIIQRGELPIHSLHAYLEISSIEDMQLVADVERYIKDTGIELRKIIALINDNDKLGVFDSAASNDLTGIASKLYHYLMFCEQALKKIPYGREE